MLLNWNGIKIPSVMLVFLGTFVQPKSTLAACTDKPPNSDFTYEKLVDGSTVGDGQDLDIANDGRVFWVERTTKKLQVYSQKTKMVTVIHTFDPSIVMSEQTNYEGNGNEGGLQGIALDPKFDLNHFVYIFYTARVPAFASGTLAPIERLSRFTLTDADTKLDLASEKKLLEFNIYAQCCHHGGDIEFGPDGNLWLTTGDNTSLSYNSDGTPINDTQVKLDARSGTANTNSYRGKVLRIHPETVQQPDGKWYTIPKGNLFPVGTPLTLPEIYSMGHRNPYSINIDPRSHGDVNHPWALVGEAGPARWTDEVNLLTKPGFFGWPFLNRNNQNMGVAKYDSNAIVNNSPFNTGMKALPNPIGAIAYYGAWGSSGHGIGGCVPGAGPFMRFDSSLNSTVKFPPYFHDKVILFAGWGGSYWVGKMSETGVLSEVSSIFSNALGGAVLRLKRGPDGALYSISNPGGGGGGNIFLPGTGDKIYKVSYKGPCNPTVAVREPVARPGLMSERPMLANLSLSTSLVIPEGIHKVELYSTTGVKVWSYQRNQNLVRTEIPTPAELNRGVYTIRYFAEAVK